MTEFEYWRETLSNEIGNVRFAVEGGIPKKCACASCNECLFDMSRDCNIQRMGWLCSEHIEKPKLTKKERMLCEILERGWITRDENGYLGAHRNKPQKVKQVWERGGDAVGLMNMVFLGIKFEFITWESGPWSVEDLLKLEVKE